MNYLAQGLMSGFQQGFDAGQDRRREKQRKEEIDRKLADDAKAMRARQTFEAEMLDKRIVADDRRWMNSEQNRHIDRSMDRMDAELRQQIEAGQQAPRNRLINAQAEAQEMENRSALAGAGAPTTPTAKVRKTFGPGNESYYEYTAPLSDIERTAANAPTAVYKSPYAREIVQQGKIIAENTAQLQSGDVRSGFLGMTNRGDTVRKAQAQMQRLKALELEDMVRAGAITQAEADRRADLILNGQ